MARGLRGQSLNPYSNGIRIESQVLCGKVLHNCLNPYSNGIRIESGVNRRMEYLRIVLILILMEYG